MGILVGAFCVVLFAPTVISVQEQPHSLFVYGTLKNNLIRYYSCRCLVPETPVTLSGYKKIGLNIVPSETDSVAGSILQITPTQLERIDRYERVPRRYTRERITIDGHTHWVYIKNE